MKVSVLKTGLLLATLVAGFSCASLMAQTEKAQTLEQLLDMVKKSQISESAEHRQREAEFARDKANRAALLAQAKTARAQEEARAAELEKIYTEQQLLVTQKKAQLSERLGSMRELFGHLTSTAGDLRGILETSLVSAQYPHRGDFLDALIEKMNGSTKLPDIEEIERLWYEIQREMIESGRVVTFKGEVVKADGETSTQNIVRVGTYNLVSNGAYVSYDGRKMEELARQPNRELLASAAALQEATKGVVDFGIDPSGPHGGRLLFALIQKPTFSEYLDQGGMVGWAIVYVGIFGILLGVWRIYVLFTMTAKVNAQLRSDKASADNPLGRALIVAEENAAVDLETLELKLEEAVLRERPAIESGLPMMKIIAAVAPLLGLLGTVTGMITTFQAITIFGAGDPKNMAVGISTALVTTVQGLVVAIPMVLMHTLVNGRAKAMIHILDEQTAGIIAENAERKAADESSANQ
ncbi:MAG: MotA/TolQ/ExbB proton channel family protein [Cellvibrio sp.]|uniref:MotA/TolQ/ExbB proton channel family protein n=1 Tax=Cellvibrio sp. TaxID=1965322 RepID=UPI0031A1E4B8